MTDPNLGFAMVVTIGLALVLVIVTPTRWGIWSTYQVLAGHSEYTLLQYFHVFGWHWYETYAGNGRNWFQRTKDGTFKLCDDSRAQWCNNKVLEWRRANGF